MGLRPQGPPFPAEETPFEVGIRVQIHSQEEPPLIDQLGFGAAPGYQTFVSCQKQQASSLVPPKPGSDSLLSPHHLRPQPQLLRPVPVMSHSTQAPTSPRASLTCPPTAELPAATLG